MKAIVNCKTCRNKIVINGFDDRVEIKKTKGKEFELYCNNCKQRNLYKPNDAYAKFSYLKYILFFLITLVLNILLFSFIYNKFNNNSLSLYYLLPISFVPYFIFILLIKEENKKIRSFNRYRV